MNSRSLLPFLLFTGGLAILLPGAACAQRGGDPLADPLPIPDNAAYAEMDVAQLDLAGPPLPANAVPPVTAPGGDTGAASSLPSAPRDATPQASPPPGTIRLNFRNASLNDVLNSLSANAGFIVVQQTPVSGTINLNSQQPVTADEAVDALNTAMSDKGYVALRNGRILKIISRENAPKSGDLPVVVGSDPPKIPRKDNMVTQILPVRYVEVGKLVDTLRPLLSDSATIASNDNANAVILTDTQNNIHRIAEIIHALDNSVSSISVIRVYTLRYADAKELADVVTQLFTPSSSTTGNNRNGQQGGFGGFPFFGGGRGGGGQQGGAPAAPTSEARQAASRVVAVADETTNSVVVSAPDEYMSAIDDLVAKLDTNTTEVTETQIFKLQHADATEVAASLTALYSDQTTANGAAGGNNGRNGNNNNNRGGFPGQANNATNSAVSDRALQQARVIAVADPRTNSVLVNASRASIGQIGLLIGRLDASDSKKQHIYVHRLAHADPTNVAYILNGMFSVSGGSNTFQQPTDSRLQTRSANGLTSDAQSTLGGSSSSSTGSRSSGSGLR